MPEAWLKGKKIVLGVTGSIAAYKAVHLLRRIQEQGADVSVVMTESATRFVAPLTFEVLSQRQVVTDLFSHQNVMPHLRLSDQADLILVAPATANALAKCSLGLADDVLSTMFLSAQCPLVFVPAMDSGMWDHPAVADNVRTLRARGVRVLTPEYGPLASGQIGQGRFPSEDSILDSLRTCLSSHQDLKGHRVLVSAGPTREPIDAVRFISNPSSGKMGYAMAQAAVARGAEVILVSGPTALPAPVGVELVPVMTAREMQQVLEGKFSWATVLLMAAAVVDFRPNRPSVGKEKKKNWQGDPLGVEPTPDILMALSKQRTHQVLVGFAAETENVLENGLEKLRRKNLDLVVANEVGGIDTAFGNDENEVILLRPDKSPVRVQRMAKQTLADRILDEVVSIKPKLDQTLKTPLSDVG